MKPEYLEITAIGQSHREFINLQTGKSVKYSQTIISQKLHVKDCPIHGW